MKHYHYTYEVEGVTAFPIDMLRYDSSYPSHEAVSYAIEDSVRHESPDGVATVTLKTTREGKGWCPTEGRWNSFGWSIVPGSIKLEGV